MSTALRMTPEAVTRATDSVVEAPPGERVENLALAARSLAYRAGGDLVVTMRGIESTLLSTAITSGLADKVSVDELFSLVRREMVRGLLAAEEELGDTGPIFWRRR